ncbi:GIY-YIG nuclease family protein [Pelagibius sp. 7325]|uniref:GIY-YIG nuclease family protein n=1 Tax=Pelagibius sp. 7325 TaxID=3131994 RepID=UPI0030EC9BE5
MLLYTLTTKDVPVWILDLTGPATGPATVDAPSVYALVVQGPAAQVYIGSTKDLRARIRQHISRCHSALHGGSGSYRRPPTSADAVLSRVVSGRSGLLVIRLEAVAPGDEELLRRLELAWLIVAARQELPVEKRRGPKIAWCGDPGELRKAFLLARKRHWPGKWIRILKPLCQKTALPDPVPNRTRRAARTSPPATISAKKRRRRLPKPRPRQSGPAIRGESPS